MVKSSSKLNRRYRQQYGRSLKTQEQKQPLKKKPQSSSSTKTDVQERLSQYTKKISSGTPKKSSGKTDTPLPKRRNNLKHPQTAYVNVLHKDYSNHINKWKHCEECSLCQNAHHSSFFRANSYVLANRRSPDVVFIMESPSISDDLLGVPAKGPAGRLLNDIIRSTQGCLQEANPRFKFTWLITTTVACLPHKPGEGAKPIKKANAVACSNRLIELLKIAKPKKIIFVGKKAAQFFPQEHHTVYGNLDFGEIIHPSSMMKMENESQFTAAYWKAVLEIIYLLQPTWGDM